MEKHDFRAHALRCAQLDQAIDYLLLAATRRAEGAEHQAKHLERSALAKLREIGPEWLEIALEPREP